MLLPEAQTVPSTEVQCDLDYRISRAQVLPQIHLSKDCAQTNFLVPGGVLVFLPQCPLCHFWDAVPHLHSVYAWLLRNRNDP